MSNWLDSGDMSLRQSIDIPPLWLAGFLLAAWGIGQLWPGSVPVLVQALGVAGVAGGIGLMIWALATFRAAATSVVPHQTPTRIITTGPFRHSRNPIYLGDALLLAGAIVWWGAWAALWLIPLFVWVIQRRFIALEEARMKHSFGAEFDDYAEKTRRWL